MNKTLENEIGQYLFSKMIKCRSKSFFFDVQSNNKGKLIISIIKRFRRWGKVQQKSFTLRDNEVEMFINALTELKTIMSDYHSESACEAVIHTPKPPEY